MPRNRQIFTGRSIRQWSGGELSFKKPDVDLHKLVASRINHGMISTIDSSEIPREALQFALNAKVEFDKVSRRDGTEVFGPTPPNFQAVIKMASIKHPDGTGHVYRFTPVSIHDLQNDAWVEITQNVELEGEISDRINVAAPFNIFVFTNNGANNVQYIDPELNQSGDLIENLSEDLPSSKFRYCTNFYNRIVMAALREENEIMFAWTGEFGSKDTTKRGLEDLDPLVNETSGFSPLIDSMDDTSDHIKGIFGFSNIMVIMRENSIWHVTKQASFTNPFNAYRAFPGIGSDSPFSIKVTRYGIVFLDRSSRSVYLYSPGNPPQIISGDIEKDLIRNITDPNLIFAGYDPVEDAYHLCLPNPSSNIVSVWTFYFKTQSWTYNEYPVMSSFDVVDLATGALAIDDLVGTIDNLEGTIDELSPIAEAKKQRIFGIGNGLLAIPSDTADTDFGSTYHTTLCSGSILLPSNDHQVAMIVFEYQMDVPGTLEIWYSTDGGAVNPTFFDPGSYILGDTFTPTVLGKPQIITFRKVIHSRRSSFAIRASNGKFSALGYEVWVMGSGNVVQQRQVPLTGA